MKLVFVGDGLEVWEWSDRDGGRIETIETTRQFWLRQGVANISLC